MKESEVPMIDPSVSLHDSIEDELVSALLVGGHTAVLVDDEIDLGLTDLGVVAREGHGFVAVLTFQQPNFH